MFSNARQELFSRQWCSRWHSINLAVGCHNFLPDMRFRRIWCTIMLLSNLNNFSVSASCNIAALWPVTFIILGDRKACEKLAQNCYLAVNQARSNLLLADCCTALYNCCQSQPAEERFCDLRFQFWPYFYCSYIEMAIWKFTPVHRACWCQIFTK